MRKFNGKPMEHWERLGKELVISVLVRAATEYGWGGKPELQSIIHRIAADRLMELANAEGAETVRELLAERDRCRENLALFVASLIGGEGK